MTYLKSCLCEYQLYWKADITDNSAILQVLQGQVSNHQIAVEKLKKAAEVLLDTRGELTPDKDEIQKTLGKIFTFLTTFF